MRADGFWTDTDSEASRRSVCNFNAECWRPLTSCCIVDYHAESIFLCQTARENTENSNPIENGSWTCNSSRCSATCPVHCLARFLEAVPAGTCVWGGLNATNCNVDLKVCLECTGVRGASDFTTHSLRRGHGDDLRRSGGTLCTILNAGGWKSSAFMNYMDTQHLESCAVLEAHMAESSDDENLEASASSAST